MNLNLIPSENCPYNEDEQTPSSPCGCNQECTLEKVCELSHHFEKQGARKRVIYGVIGVHEEVTKVYSEMTRIGYSGGVYTLMMSEFDDRAHKKPNMDEIVREIRVFNKLAAIDPQGDFTPVLLYSCLIKAGTKQFHELETISNNIRTHQRKSRDFNSNKHLQEMVSLNQGGIIFMYVTDAGKTLWSLLQNLNEFPPSITISTQDAIECTRKLANNYQKLAAEQIGHFDLHSSNITYTITNGKIDLKIIDFGYNEFYQDGVRSNYLHFLYSGIEFGRRHTAETHIRECDPVHYIMFIMAFEMFRTCLSVHNTDGRRPLQPDIISEIINIMSDGLFVQSNENQIKEVMAEMLGYPPNKMYGESIALRTKYKDFFNVVVDRYGSFYNMRDLKEIWWRVCRKMKECVYRYGNENTKYIQELSAFRSYDSVNGFEINQNGLYVFRGMPAYLVIFDYFSMAFYDKELFDYDIDFLKKKFDEFSIGFYSVHLMKIVYFIDEKDRRLAQEISRVQDNFSAPRFFIRSDVEEIFPPRQVQQEYVYAMDGLPHVDITQSRCEKIEIQHRLTAGAETPQQRCTIS